jgi:cytochrome P450
VNTPRLYGYAWDTTLFDGAGYGEGHVEVADRGAANRDPDEFDRPDEVIPDREPRRVPSLLVRRHETLPVIVARRST